MIVSISYNCFQVFPTMLIIFIIAVTEYLLRNNLRGGFMWITFEGYSPSLCMGAAGGHSGLRWMIYTISEFQKQRLDKVEQDWIFQG